MFDEKQHYENSSLRENIIEHLFIGQALRQLWNRGITTAEILRSEFDAYGYDLVISYGSLVRHVQLKSGTSPKTVSVSSHLAQKPSGCVVFIALGKDLEMDAYFLFSAEPGEPLLIDGFPQAKRTTPKSDGIKPFRVNHRKVPPSKFRKHENLTSLMSALLGLNMEPITDDP